MPRHLVALALSLGCAGKSQLAPRQLDRPAPTPAARLSPAAFVVAFPESACGACQWPAETLPNRFAGPFWQILVKVDTGWLGAVQQLEPDSTLRLPAFRSATELVRAGHTRGCRLDSHVIVCAESLEARTTVQDSAVVFTVMDRRWIERLTAGRPSMVHLAFGQPNTQTLWQDSVRVEYLVP